MFERWPRRKIDLAENMRASDAFIIYFCCPLDNSAPYLHDFGSRYISRPSLRLASFDIHGFGRRSLARPAENLLSRFTPISSLARPFAREVVCAKNDVLLRNSPPRSSDDHRHLWVSGFRWRPRPPTTTLPTQRNGRCICPSSVCTHEEGAMLMLNTPIGGRPNGILRTVFE